MTFRLRLAALATVLTISLVPARLNAQDGTSADLPTLAFNEEFALALPEADGLAPAYAVDLSDFGFQATEESTRFAYNLSDNLVRFEAGNDPSAVRLVLQTQYKPDWTVADWNAYLAEIAPRFRYHAEQATGTR
jgi:hypothetical protein